MAGLRDVLTGMTVRPKPVQELRPGDICLRPCPPGAVARSVFRIVDGVRVRALNSPEVRWHDGSRSHIHGELQVVNRRS